LRPVIAVFRTLSFFVANPFELLMMDFALCLASLIFLATITSMEGRSGAMLATGGTGSFFDVDRGPDWVFVRFTAADVDWTESPPVAEAIWNLLEQSFTYRLVVEFDRVALMRSYLLGQLVLLARRVSAASRPTIKRWCASAGWKSCCPTIPIGARPSEARGRRNRGRLTIARNCKPAAGAVPQESLGARSWVARRDYDQATSNSLSICTLPTTDRSVS
jgi:hypothetical protein